MVRHLITDIAIRCGHINEVTIKECNHHPKCSRRFESHVELKPELCRNCKEESRFHIHFRRLSDSKSLKRYWSMRYLFGDKSIRGPFTISAQEVVDAVDVPDWKTVWHNQILHCINNAKNGAMTVFMTGLQEILVDEMDVQGGDFVKEAVRRVADDADQSAPTG